MAKLIAYVGTSDVRELSKKDLAPAGVEDQGKLTFHRGERIELDDKVVDYLLEHPSLVGEFKEVDEEEDLRLSPVKGVTSDDAPASDTVSPASGGTASPTGGGAATTPTRTGGATGGRRTSGRTGT